MEILFLLERVVTKFKRSTFWEWRFCPPKTNPWCWRTSVGNIKKRIPKTVARKSKELPAYRRSWKRLWFLHLHWNYTYPEIAIQNPSSNLKIILILKIGSMNHINKLGRPQGSKNLKESWKNTIPSERKPPNCL